MGLRDDIKFIVKQEYEPKVPSEDIILQQAIHAISHGKSTGNAALDKRAINELNSKEEAR